MKLRVKEIAKVKGITLQEIGEKLGTTKQAISTTIRRGNPKLQTLEKIAEVLGVKVSNLLDESDDGIIECPVCGSLIDKRTGERLPSNSRN